MTRCFPAASPPVTRSSTPCRWTSPWEGPRTRSSTPSPPRRRARSTSACATSTTSPARCRAWRKSRRTPTTGTSKTSTAPAASRRCSASLTARGCFAATFTPSTPTTWIRGSSAGTSAAAIHARRRSTDSEPRRGACAPPSPSRKTPRGRASTPTPPPGASDRSRKPIRRTAGWPCSSATSPRTAPSSRPPAWMSRSSTSRAAPASSSRRRPASSSYCPRPSSPATSSSSFTKAPREARACRRCCTRRRSSRDWGWGRCAGSSPTGASPAAPPGCLSATFRRRPRPAGPSG